jgi:very-short-patch-repair endonuclease
VVHRRRELAATRHLHIPVTTPATTLVDLAAQLSPGALAAAVNEADKRDLIDAQELRTAIESMSRRPGLAALRDLLDRDTFLLTDSELERSFLRIVCRARLPPPLTQRVVNGYRVDFYWPDSRLVVETDGLRYHRTPAQQAGDLRREQAHTAAGLTTLRFTHFQVRYEPDEVRVTLLRVIAATQSRP